MLQISPSRVIWSILLVVLLAGPGPAQAGDPYKDLAVAKAAAGGGDYSKAVKHFTAAIKSEGLKGDNLARAYYGRGNAYLDWGNLDKAVSDLTRAVEIKPDMANAYYSRAFAWNYKGMPDMAIDDFGRLLKISPEDSEAYFLRGNAYFDKSEFEKALADYDQALELDPSNDDALYNRAMTKVNLGRIDSAEQDLKAALLLAPESQAYRQALENLRAVDEPALEESEVKEKSLADKLKFWKKDEQPEE